MRLKKIHSEQGISTLEMLFVSIALLIFMLAIFIVTAAYWNSTILQSTAQNSSLTAQFTTNAALSKVETFSQIESACKDIPSPYCTPAPNITVINPWYAAKQIIKNSTDHLILVPKGLNTPDCLNYYSANPDPPDDNSSKMVQFTIGQTVVAANKQRETTVQLSVPFPPLPMPSGSGEQSDDADNCNGIFNIKARSTTRFWIP